MLPSIEYRTTKEHGSEGPFPTNIRLAAAVTLRTGSVVVTGGRGGERDVWMSTVDTPVMWSRRQDMLEGRKGHAAVVVNIGSEDMVVVAGGWGNGGKELDSVHVYKPELDKWDVLQKMPAPRVDFDLHFQVYKC